MRITFILIFSIACLCSIDAQEFSSVKRLKFNKGEIVDIIIATQFSNTPELFSRYKETVFPVAFKYTYQLQPSFEIDDLILGNHKPQYMIFGKWQNSKMKESFLHGILSEVPDFHSQRQAIFDEFQLTYFEIEEDIDVSIDTDKYQVVSSFWQENEKALNQFVDDWVAKATQHGGVHLIRFENGRSPLGYRYNPDFLIITQWESRSDFEAFLSLNPLPTYEALEDVHQFSLTK